LASENYESIFGHLVGLLRREISPLQHNCLHRTPQHRKTWTHTHASSWIRTYDSTVRPIEDRQRLRQRGHWYQL